MKRASLMLFFLLFSVATFAATPSNASLKGSYSFQVSNTKDNHWGEIVYTSASK